MRVRWAALAATAAAASVMVPAPAHAKPALEDVGSFNAPMTIGGIPGRGGDVVVVEREGALQLVEDDVVADEPFADLSARVDTLGERGLLSVAFAPDYAHSGRLYVFFAAEETADYDLGDLVVEELRRDPADPDRADPAYHRTVLRVPHPDPSHYGGQLAFGPDGLLYVSTGDGGGSDDPELDAQNLSNLLGKMLRIDPDAGAGCDGGCTVPADNPFVGTDGVRPEIWAYGLRNPWRFSIDRLTGDIVIADVGQDDIEEINVLWADDSGGGAGANFGWPCTEGTPVNDAGVCAIPDDHVPPVIEQEHPLWKSITGGVVVRDPAVPSLAGRFLYTDFFNNVLFAATLKSDAGFPSGLFTDRVSSIAQDDEGRVWVTSLFGPVRRLVEVPEDAPPPGDTPPSATGPSGTTAPPDGQSRAGSASRTLLVDAFHSRRQPALRTRRIRLTVRCTAACRVQVAGRVGPRGRRLPARSRRLPAGARRRITVVLPRSLVHRLLRDRRRADKPVRAHLTLRVTDSAGSARTRKLRIRLTR